MSDTRALPPPGEPAATEPLSRRLAPLPLLALAAFVILALAVIWLFVTRPQIDANDLVHPAQVAALQQQVQTLEQRLARVEQRPVPAPPDLRPIEARIAALEHRPQPSAPDLGPLEERLAKLEARPEPPPAPDLAPLEARLAKLEGRPQVPADVATKGDIAAFASRLDAVAGREDQLAERQQGLETNFGNKLDALGTRLTATEHEAAALPVLSGRIEAGDKRMGEVERTVEQVPALADKAVRIGRIQAAQSALDSGQPLGDLPGAPPSLSRFAHAAPPTEAALRLSFPAAASAAEQASRPSTEGQPFLDRMWLRAQDLVSLREGDHVLVGDPASGVIARARRALVAGDLAGAVAALDGLSGPAAQAISGWRAQAQSLLDARAALATMATHA